MSRQQVKRRTRWSELTPMPSHLNPIYGQRLKSMGDYRPQLVGSPIVVDNKRLAFPELPEDALTILDGNHRYALAQLAGALEDEVIIDLRQGLTRREVFELREGVDNRRSIKPAERFIHKREMGDLRKRKISDEVELLGFQITFERADMGLSCTNELEWIYDRSPAAMTQAVITYLAAWGGKQFSAQARVIKGLGAFWIKFPDADMERLAGALRRSDTSVQKLYDAGRLENDKLPFIKSVTDGIRYVLTGIYNQGLRGGRRLPMT